MERPDTESEDESGSSATDASDDEEEAAEGAEARPHSRRAAAKMKVAALDIINGASHCFEQACCLQRCSAMLSCLFDVYHGHRRSLTRCAGRLAVF